MTDAVKVLSQACVCDPEADMPNKPYRCAFCHAADNVRAKDAEIERLRACISETVNDAERWRALMRAGVTYHESDGEPPVLAAVSKRIWYHATDDQEHNTLAEAMDAYAALFPEPK